VIQARELVLPQGRCPLCRSVVPACAVGVIILRNGTEHLENMKQLCKSSLQCQNSMSCIWLDRARQALHAGTFVAQILVSRKNWMHKHEGGNSRKVQSKTRFPISTACT